jgi:hypothetical protein
MSPVRNEVGFHIPEDSVLDKDIVFCRSIHRSLVMDNVPSSPIFVSLMMETLCSSETSVLIRATWHNIPEDGILHSHRRENLNSYKSILPLPNIIMVQNVSNCEQ